MMKIKNITGIDQQVQHYACYDSRKQLPGPAGEIVLSNAARKRAANTI